MWLNKVSKRLHVVVVDIHTYKKSNGEECHLRVLFDNGKQLFSSNSGSTGKEKAGWVLKTFNKDPSFDVFPPFLF